jgi:hypothetical protein
MTSSIIGEEFLNAGSIAGHGACGIKYLDEIERIAGVLPEFLQDAPTAG